MLTDLCHISSGSDEEKCSFTYCVFGLKEEVLVIANDNNEINFYEIEDNDGEKEIVLKNTIHPYLGKINSLRFSPKYEFLFANCDKGVALIKGDGSEVFNVIISEYPVMSC